MQASWLHVPKQALNSVPCARAEWLLWLDMDMVLEDVTFALPLASYAGKDLVMWGQPEWIMKGHNAKGGGGCLLKLSSTLCDNANTVSTNVHLDEGGLQDFKWQADSFQTLCSAAQD